MTSWVDTCCYWLMRLWVSSGRSVCCTRRDVTLLGQDEYPLILYITRPEVISLVENCSYGLCHLYLRFSDNKMHLFDTQVRIMTPEEFLYTVCHPTLPARSLGTNGSFWHKGRAEEDHPSIPRAFVMKTPGRCLKKLPGTQKPRGF